MNPQTTASQITDQKPNQNQMRHHHIILMLIASSFVLPLQAEDWPQFRGPLADGIVRDTGILKAWPSDGPAKTWSIKLGGGYSGLSVVDGVIFTQFSQEKDEFAAAIDASTGKEIWRFRTDDVRRDQFGDGPRSTPTIDGDRVFLASAFGKLHALERKTGKALWSVDLRKEYEATVPTWGVSASPIVVDNLLLMDIGGKAGYALVGFDKATGKLTWNSESGLPGYALPIRFTVGGIEQVLFFAGQKLVAVEPKTGKKIWEYPWQTAYDVNAATPIFLPPNRLFVSSGYDTGAAMLRLQVAGNKVAIEEEWRTRGMKNQFSSSVHWNGHIYGFDNKTLKCIDAANGQDLWRKSGFGHGSLLLIDNHLIVLGDNGKLALVEATPSAYLEKSSVQAAEGKHWTVPTYSAGNLLVRNEQDLISFKIR
jgi:outer membrane protein assembly factor BamB